MSMKMQPCSRTREQPDSQLYSEPCVPKTTGMFQYTIDNKRQPDASIKHICLRTPNTNENNKCDSEKRAVQSVIKPLHQRVWTEGFTHLLFAVIASANAGSSSPVPIRIVRPYLVRLFFGHRESSMLSYEENSASWCLESHAMNPCTLVSLMTTEAILTLPMLCSAFEFAC